MIKLVFILILAMLFAIFASQNMNPVLVHVVLGNPIQVPVIIIVFAAFMFGMIVTLFFAVVGRTKNNKGLVETDEDE